MFFRLIRLSVLLSLSELKEKRIWSIDLLPYYGPGTSKRYRKPVTTGNTVIFYCEKRNFRRSANLAEDKIYLFAVLLIFDMPSTNHSVRNYRSPGRHWRLTFRVGDHQLATWSPKNNIKMKEKKRKIEQSRIFRKEGGQIGNEHSFFRSSASVWSRTKHGSRSSRLFRVCEVLQSSTVQSLHSRCFPHVRLQDREQRDKTTPCPNTQLESRFTFLTLLRRERRRTDQSGHSSFPFRFDRVRDTDCETLTCHVHATRYSAVFSATSLSTRVVERTKRHNNGTILSQKKAGGSTAWASFRLGFDRLRDTDRAKLPPVTRMRRCYRVQRWCLQGRSGSRPRSSRERSANATQGCLCKNIKNKRKRAQT